MSENYRIEKRATINTKAWDACINNSINKLIYAYSWYLDAMCDNWEALILNDYEAVMPLPIRYKWGIKYVYQPAFIQQLGLFYSKNAVFNCNKIEKILNRNYLYGNFQVNANWKNSTENVIITKHNMLVPLTNNYDIIFSNYSRDFVRNLKKSSNQPLTYNKSTDFIGLIDRYKHYYGKRFPHIKESDYNKLKYLVENLLNNSGNYMIRSISNDKNEIIAEVLLLMDNNRYYNIMNCVNAEGRKKSANYFLYYNLLKEISGQEKLLDLEGSEIAGIKAFYQNFNPLTESYYVVKIGLLRGIL